MSIRGRLKFSGFCLFMTFAMLVMSSVLIWCAGQQNLDSPITIVFEASKVSLTFAQNDGSVVTPDNCAIVKSADGTQFKIVGPTPILTSTTASANETNSERTAIGDEGININSRETIAGEKSSGTSGPTGKVSAITDLANSDGAEFYYFCTNSAVTSTTGYTDPGTIYWTSTADSTLETWYNYKDISGSELKLYACFMKPNYTGGTYSGSDTQIVISNSVTSIGGSAFCDCWGITSVIIPQSAKTIEDGYWSLSSFEGDVGYSVEQIGFFERNGMEREPVAHSAYGAFFECSALERVVFPNSLTYIGECAFWYCSSLTSITIPDSVTSIGCAAFSDCYGLTSIIIPSGVTSIGSYAFSDCSSLTSIIIPSGVTSIGADAFSGCTGLTSVTIPSSVTSIGGYAFYGCSKLTSVIFENTSKSWKIANYSGSTVKVSAYSPTNASTNATYLKSTYYSYYWTKNS